MQLTFPLFPGRKRSAASKLDWAKVSSSLGLKGQTAAALLAFKKRNDDARRKINLLSSQPSSVDFADYRSKLKNTAIVDEIEGHFKTFKPVKYDLDRQLKSIEMFEAQAVQSAEETKRGVDEEVRNMERTLKNIEEARPLKDLTVVSIRIYEGLIVTGMITLYVSQDDVVAARPDIDVRTEQLVSKGRWYVPGYQVRNFCVLFLVPSRMKVFELANKCRKNSEIFRFFKCEWNRSVHPIVSQETMFSLAFHSSSSLLILQTKPKSRFL